VTVAIDALAPATPPALSAARGLDDGRLEAMRRMNPAEGRRAAARELGEVFFMQLVAALRRTLPNGLFPQAPGRDVYESMFDQQMAQALAAEDPLGLVERLAPGAEGGEPVAAPATPTLGFPARAPGAGSAPGISPSGGTLAVSGTPALADAVARGVESGRAKDV
jgi:hypothetical protein